MQATILSGLLWLALLAPASLLADHQLLANGDFDTGIEPWTLSEETDATVYEVSWDGAMGDPTPGALRLAQPSGLARAVGEVVSECFDVAAGETLELRARVFAEGAVDCRPTFIQYSGPGCTGSRTFGGIDGSGPPPRTPPGLWVPTSVVLTTSDAFPSLRVGLAHRFAGSEGSTCRFDGVVLGDPAAVSVTEIPTSSELGLWLFAGLLAVGAGWVLRTAG